MSFDNTTYSVFNSSSKSSSLDNNLTKKKYVSRKEMIRFILSQYPDYIQNEDYKNQNLFIISQLRCVCTDCNGNDSISECKIESYYFNLKSMPELTDIVYI
jgi:hypothetical protein